MSRYKMQPRVYNKFVTKGYHLSCKICGAPITIGDDVESKSGSEGPILYHAECYDGYHLEFTEDGKILNGHGNMIKEE